MQRQNLRHHMFLKRLYKGWKTGGPLLSSGCFNIWHSHHLGAHGHLLSDPTHFSNQTYCPPAGKGKDLQPLASTFQSNHYPPHIPQNINACLAVGALLLYKMSPETHTTPNPHASRPSAQGPPVVLNSSTQVAASTFFFC